MSLVENVGESSSRNGHSAAKQPASSLEATFEAMRRARQKTPDFDYDTRISHLEKLERVLLAKKHEIAKAVSADFGVRSKHESLVAEVLIPVNGIKHARLHLHEWMETEPREVSWLFLPGRAEVMMQPVGIVGIISPWNYPVNLAISPLIGAIAAGNRVLLKPSELTPETSELLKSIVSETYAPDHVAVITGGADVGEAFTHVAFDHLIFTGSTRVGKAVMKAAAENLVPVTLELGGKSPAIVGEGYSLAQAATKIVQGKCFNAGQTCVAPDYALVPKAKRDAFVEECRAAFVRMYPSIEGNDDFTTIINQRHYDRLQGYVQDARSRGATVIELGSGKSDPATRKMAPVIVVDPTEEMTVMQDEIFGPILPVRSYASLDEAIAYVNDRPRPLALYMFEHDPKRIDRVMRETVAGGVTINETMLHLAQDDLPFGGAGASGMGHYHGREGFEALTKKKSIFYQSRISSISLLRPPYKSKLDFVLRTLLGR